MITYAGVIGHAQAAPMTADYVQLEVGSGKLVTLSAPARSVFSSDPHVAKVGPASPGSLYIMALAPGHTRVEALSATGAAVGEFEVEVSANTDAIDAAIRKLLPNSTISVSAAGNEIEIAGNVASADTAAEVVQAVMANLAPSETLINHITISQSVQVSLQVRIAEMSRTLTRELGVNWNSSGELGQHASFGVLGSINTQNVLASLTNPASAIAVAGLGRIAGVNAVIDALSQDQLIHMLAEPNLTALSGETASFLVGGEFPIPIAQNSSTGSGTQVTVDFKQYGVSLSFVPTVLSDGEISLHVRPEVSELTTQGAVNLSISSGVSLQIPALLVRRADTTVMLGSGQSFAIAGLLEDQSTHTSNGLPGLGDIPILGALFRSDSFIKGDTELVIVVTPYIVRPVDHPAALSLPTDHWQAPSDEDRLLKLQQDGAPQ